MEQLEAWANYLNQNLTWPFQGEIEEFVKASGPLQVGDLIKVRKIKLIDDLYGIIVEVTKRPRRIHYHCPLAGIATSRNSPNSDSLQAYRSWFANR